MICRNCQAEVQDLPFCPQCGHRLKETPLGKRARRQRFFRRWVFPLSILVVVLAFGILALALTGFRDGTEEREQASRHQAEIHYNRGQVYLECGQPQLAEAHFEEALRLAPDYAQALDQLQVARARQTVTPSPTPQPTVTPTPTPVVPTPTTEVIVVPLTDVLYEEGTAHYEAHEWEQAISKLEQLRLEDVNYRSDQVIEMLFESHKAYGQALEKGGQVEAAILQYDHALDLRPRNPEVSEWRRQADLYQSALSDWEVNWESVISFLIALYHVAPDYRDATDRLYEACVIYGEALIKDERYCAASEYFEQAVEIRDDQEAIVQREQDTSYLCEIKPEPLGTPTTNGSTSEWSTVHIGTLIGTCYDPHNDQYDICAQNAEDNVLETWITQAEQPAITLDGTWLAYRSSDPERPGLYAMDMISGTVLTITADVNAHYPTWSPDGTRVAYSQYDQDDETWFIHVAALDDDAPPARIHKGEWPDWGPGGLLAFSTCGEENDCGIHVFDPDSGALTRITASIQDRAPDWSPTGDEIAYTADIALSFNLLVVRILADAAPWVRQISENLFTDVMPTWSPDGQRIAFITNHDDNWSVYSVHPYPGESQAAYIAGLGAKSADWQRLKLAWAAQVVRLPQSE